MGYLEAIERMKKPHGKSKAQQKPWLKAWHELAQITYGVEPGDVRLGPVLEALDRCDEAFYADDWPTFEQVAQHIRSIMSTEGASQWARTGKKRRGLF